MRTAAGFILAAQGIISLFASPQLTMGVLLVGALLAATGVLILIGFLTPVFSLLAGLECLAMAVFGVSLPLGLFDSRLVAIQATAIFVAIAFIGPGAYSLDARLFGWKEIVIPAAPHRPEQ